MGRVAGKIRRMIGRAKEGWRRFGASRPGHRFRDRYRYQQENERGWRDPRRLFFVVGGLAIAAASLVFGVLPGPGTLTFFVGLAMVSGEFYPVAPPIFSREGFTLWSMCGTNIVLRRPAPPFPSP